MLLGALDGDVKQKDVGGLTVDLLVKNQAEVDHLRQHLFIEGNAACFAKSLAIGDGKLRIPEEWVLLNGAVSIETSRFPAVISVGTVYELAARTVGGDEAFKKCKDKSEKIGNSIKDKWGADAPTGQDDALQALTIRELFASAEKTNRWLGERLQQLLDHLNERFRGRLGPGGIKLNHPPCKGMERAGDKALMKYGNDVTRLKDLSRATLEVDSLDVDVFYDILDAMNDFSLMQTESCHWTAFEDRMQQAMSGGYRDTQWVLYLGGHLCEVQTTMAVFSSAKTVGHGAYEGLRRKTESTLLASVRQMPALVHQLLQTGANPNGIKDKHGLYPLHFASLLGQEHMVKHLLAHGADPFRTDTSSRFAVQLALDGSFPSIVQLLGETMENQLAKAELRDERAKQQCQKLVLKAVDIAACSTPVWKDALLALGKTSTDVLAPVLRVGIHLSGTPVLSYVQRFIERERGEYALPLMHQCVVPHLSHIQTNAAVLCWHYHGWERVLSRTSSWLQTSISLQEIRIRSWRCQNKS